MSAKDSKTCRICFETETFCKKMINPCKCKGSSKYVHQDCLKAWLERQPHQISSYKCEICHWPYRFGSDSSGFSVFCVKVKENPKNSVILFMILIGICVYPYLVYETFNHHYDEISKNEGLHGFLVILFCLYLACLLGCGINVIKVLWKYKVVSFRILPYYQESEANVTSNTNFN